MTKTMNNNSLCALRNGFTLVELMVVILIVGIMISIGLPRIRSHILMGHLNDAKPYLMSIAAKARIYYNQRGKYFDDAKDPTKEDDLISTLGVDLRDATDYCFVMRIGKSNFISGSGTDPGFEVWGVLRKTGGTGGIVNVTSSSVTCTPATGKNPSTGWVTTGDDVGGEGRVIVLRYPPIADGMETNVNYNRSGRSGFMLDWNSGITITDAIF